jgi:hypothetical protein
MRKLLISLIFIGFALVLKSQTPISYVPEFLKWVKFDSYINFKGNQVNYMMPDSTANPNWVRNYISTHPSLIDTVNKIATIHRLNDSISHLRSAITDSKLDSLKLVTKYDLNRGNTISKYGLLDFDDGSNFTSIEFDPSTPQLTMQVTGDSSCQYAFRKRGFYAGENYALQNILNPRWIPDKNYVDSLSHSAGSTKRLTNTDGLADSVIYIYTDNPIAPVQIQNDNADGTAVIISSYLGQGLNVSAGNVAGYFKSDGNLGLEVSGGGNNIAQFEWGNIPKSNINRYGTYVSDTIKVKAIKFSGDNSVQTTAGGGSGSGIPYTGATKGVDLNGHFIKHNTFSDTSDSTKTFQFLNSGNSTGVTRSITVPNRDFELDSLTTNTSVFNGILKGSSNKLAAVTAGDLTTLMGVATTSTNGYLSSADWNTFSGKQTALGYTPLTWSDTTTVLSWTKNQIIKKETKLLEDTIYVSAANLLSGINDTLINTTSPNTTTQNIYTNCIIYFKKNTYAYTGGTTDTIAVFGKLNGVKKKLLYISSSHVTDFITKRGSFTLEYDALDPGSPIWVHIPQFTAAGTGVLRMRFYRRQEIW